MMPMKGGGMGVLTKMRHSIIGLFPGQFWKDFCCHWGIHQDTRSEPHVRKLGTKIHYCSNPHCQLILRETEEHSESSKETNLNWTLEA